jgi:AMP nucleosidase
MLNKLEIAKNWLPRYTGMPLDKFGEFILLTNFNNYVQIFADQFGCEIYGEDRTMPAATNDAGLTIINFGMGSSNAATVMDLLSSIRPKGVLFLGKCGGLKKSTEIGHFILPIAAIRGEGTSDDYFPQLVPAAFHRRLGDMTCIGIDMETATLFIVGHANEISRGALLLVSDVPVTPDGVKTEESDRKVTADWVKLHLQIGIEAMTELGQKGEMIKHFRY